MKTFPKPIKVPPEKRRMSRGKNRINEIGPVSRAHLKLNVELTAQAEAEDWIFICEVRPILAEHGLVTGRCSPSDLTFAHSRKSAQRGGDPILERQVARACRSCHFFVLDLLPPRLTELIVLEAIARRTMEPAEELSLIELSPCSDCLRWLLNAPSHDPNFTHHLNHASLITLQKALTQNVSTKPARQRIDARVRKLEREARWR